MTKGWITPALAGAVAMCLGSTAGAETYEAGGHQYWLSCNKNGYVLESARPVTRRGYTGIETLYLGRGCDTFVKGLGTGSWCWANVGFFATRQVGGSIDLILTIKSLAAGITKTRTMWPAAAAEHD